MKKMILVWNDCVDVEKVDENGVFLCRKRLERFRKGYKP